MPARRSRSLRSASGNRTCGAVSERLHFASTRARSAVPLAELPEPLAAYHAAIEHGYRFYSYGDAMLIT